MSESEMKKDWPIIGNQTVIGFLKRNIKSEKIVHAYLFVGPKQTGKRAVANIFSKTFFCQNPTARQSAAPCESCDTCQQFEKGIHSDSFVLSKAEDKKNISIEDVRLFQHELNTTSLLGNIKVGLIDDAADLSEAGANALLKTLEEPPNNSIIILIAQSPELLPSTIISRCQRLTFHPVSRSEISLYLTSHFDCPVRTAEKIAALSLGRPGRAIDFFKHPIALQKYEEILDDFLYLFKRGVPARFALAQKYLGIKSFPARIKRTEEITNIWLSVVRDLILIKEDKSNRMVHSDRIKTLKQLARSISRKDLLQDLKELTSFQESLSRNVNPQLALENYFLNLQSYA